MLRLVALLLLLANAAYFAWSQGLLLPWGFGPAQQSEPHRLAQQIRPESVRLLKPDDVRRLETAAAAAATRPAECLAAGPWDDAQVQSLRTALEGWPAGSWNFEPQVEPARWIVYMGKYASADLVNRKKAELRQLGISFEPLSNASLEPGLSLGGHASEESAKAQMDAMVERGVRTARVVQERPELRGQRLVLPAIDDALRPRLEELRPLLNGKSLRPCR
jgi:hypothetical protein